MGASIADLRVLAIDGGGTHCRFALAGERGPQREPHSFKTSGAASDAPGDNLVVVEAGPANATTDITATIHCINEGLQSLSQTTGLSPEQLYDLPAFVGLAGVTSNTIAKQLQSALPLRNALYTEDRIAALRGAFGTADGLIAHCGTGSFFASQSNGTHRFAGGWGSVLGDEASAQWIGRMALATALQQSDGFLPASPLTRHVFDRFGSTDNIVDFARTATPEHFGSLAPTVTRQAQHGDANARHIMQAGASYIAQGIYKMGWNNGTAICFTGGIGPYYEPYLPDKIVTNITQPLGTPLDGAVALAFAHAETADGYS
jgi:glucosamine kinase